MLSTINQVSEYLRKITQVNEFNNLHLFTTIDISNSLNISRTLTSQYLNQLNKEGILIKISTRPVLYFFKKVLENKFKIEISNNEFLSIGELKLELNNNTKKPYDFESAIGYYGSLENCFSIISSAIHYPPNGLPIMLVGEFGVGKNYIVSLIYEHLKNNNLLEKNKKFYKIIVSRDNNEYVNDVIFGNGENVGILNNKDIGLLYIKNVNLLSETIQIKLSEYLSTGMYISNNDKKVKKSNIRIIFDVTVDRINEIHNELLLKLPTICKIPNYNDRFDDEKYKLIFKLFSNEQFNLNKEIFVSKKVIESLKNYSFLHNINGLEKTIKNLCAKEYSKGKDKLEIKFLDLPNDILKNIETEYLESNDLVKISNFSIESVNSSTITLFRRLIELYFLNRNDNSTKRFLEDAYNIIRDYYDFLIFEYNFNNIRLKTLESLVFSLISKIKRESYINLPMNCSNFIAMMIELSTRENSEIKKFEKDFKEEIDEFEKYLSTTLFNENIIATNIIKNINNGFEIKLTSISKIFLILNLNLYNKEIRNQETVGIIITHGYSTASSIADAANTLLNNRLFEAINMPLNTSTNEIFEKVNEFIDQHPFYKNIILMVDMGSLENIGSKINANVNVGVINNISTSVALSIGNLLIQNKQIEDILHEVCSNTHFTYKIISNVKKENAIIFTNDAGLKVSEKLSKLFRSSINKQIDLKFIEYDYHNLLKNGIEDLIFEKYNVLLVVKPYNLDLKNIPQVSLEDIVSYKDIDKVNNALKSFLSKSEIETFNKELLKNFSLTSIMENITILNPHVLLDYVSDSINTLQSKMNCKFQSKTIVGLYIHVCFLIERLITKNPIESTNNIEEFEKENKKFIKYVNSSFESLLKNYNVTMPLEEIVYLFDYIKNDMEFK